MGDLFEFGLCEDEEQTSSAKAESNSSMDVDNSSVESKVFSFPTLSLETASSPAIECAHMSPVKMAAAILASQSASEGDNEISLRARLRPRKASAPQQAEGVDDKPSRLRLKKKNNSPPIDKQVVQEPAKPLHPFFMPKNKQQATGLIVSSETNGDQPASPLAEIFLTPEQRKARKTEEEEKKKGLEAKKFKESLDQTKQWDAEFWKGRATNPFLQPRKKTESESPSTTPSIVASSATVATEAEANWPTAEQVHVNHVTTTNDHVNRPLLLQLRPMPMNDMKLHWQPNLLMLLTLSTPKPPPPHAFISKADAQASLKSWLPSLSSIEVPVTSSSADLWTEKYKPKTSKQIIGNVDAVARLGEWLQKWKPTTADLIEKLRPASPPEKKKPRRRHQRIVTSSSSEEEINVEDDFQSMKKRKRASSSLGGFIVDDDDDDDNDHDDDMDTDNDDVNDSIATAVVLCGAPGIGKTALVYALCQELSIEVLEVNAASRRTGKDLHSLFGESTQSHMVVQPWMQQQAAQQQAEMQGDRVKSTKKRRSKKPVAPPPPQLPAGTLDTVSVILMEDVDVIFEEDKGFWGAVNDFIKTSKRPLILTCNGSFGIENHLELAVDWIVLTPPPVDDVVALLETVAINEGFFVPPRDLIQLSRLHHNDVRRSLLALQALRPINMSSTIKDPLQVYHLPIESLGGSSTVMTALTSSQWAAAELLLQARMDQMDQLRSSITFAVDPPPSLKIVDQLDALASFCDALSINDAMIATSSKALFDCLEPEGEKHGDDVLLRSKFIPTKSRTTKWTEVQLMTQLNMASSVDALALSSLKQSC